MIESYSIALTIVAASMAALCAALSIHGRRLAAARPGAATAMSMTSWMVGAMAALNLATAVHASREADADLYARMMITAMADSVTARQMEDALMDGRITNAEAWGMTLIGRNDMKTVLGRALVLQNGRGGTT